MYKFDRIAEIWDASPARLKGAEQIYNAISGKIKIQDHMIVADYGTGTGLLLIHIQPYVKQIFGFDNSDNMLKMLDEKVKVAELTNVSRILHDANKHTLPAGKFDLFVSSMTFHHINKVQEFLKEAYNSLIPGGRFAIADLETEDGSFHGEPDETVVHLGFDKTDFLDMMKTAGFRNPTCETIFSIDREDKSFPIFLAYGEK